MTECIDGLKIEHMGYASDAVILGPDEANKDLEILDTDTEQIRNFRSVVLQTDEFANGSNLKTIILGKNVIPDGKCFSDFCNLETLVFVSDTIKIPDRIAMGCIRLKNLMIPDSVKWIGERAFYGCGSLEALEIPTQCEMGKEAFYKCPNLQSVFTLYYSSNKIDYKHAIEREVVYGRDRYEYMNKSMLTSPVDWEFEIINIGHYATHPCSGRHFALLTHYPGSDQVEELEIPSSVNGIPVIQWEPSMLYQFISLKTLKWHCHYILDEINMTYFPNWIRNITLPGAKLIHRSPIPKEHRNHGFLHSVYPYKKPSHDSISSYEYYQLPYYMEREQKLETVQLPEGLLEIESYTFLDCSHLNRLELPSTLKTIGVDAFSACGLKEIIFHDSQVVINYKAFSNCPELEHVEFGSRLKEIARLAFTDSPLLKEVLIPQKAKIDGAFPKSTKVIRYAGTLMNPEIFETEGGNQFTYIVLPNPWRAVILSVIPGADGKVTLPDRICDIPVTAIADSAIAFRNGLREIVIPDSIAEIGLLGIYGCPDLEIILLEHENELPHFYENAIGRNPSAVVCVKNSDLRRRLMERQKQRHVFSLEGDDGFGAAYVFHIETGALVISGSGAMKSYKNTEVSGKSEELHAPWNCMVKRVRSLTLKGFETVGAYAFRGLEKLTSINLNEGIKWISQYAFADCKNLPEVQLPSSLKKIYSHAFYNCGKLERVIFPEGLELIGSHAFFKTALTTVVIPKSVKTLGTSAFMECRNLREIYLEGTKPAVLGSTGSPVNTVFWNVAEDCRIYTRILNFSSLANNCNYTTQIIEPEGSDCGRGANGELTADVKWLLDFEGILKVSGKNPDGKYRMMDYQGGTAPWTGANQPIRSVQIRSEVKEIGAFAFFGCAMKQLNIEGAEVIGEQAFSRCSGLRTISLPKELKKVGSEAFAFLDQVQQIYYGGTKSEFWQIEWGKDVFRMCNNQMIQCADGGVTVCAEAAHKPLHMEYRVFGADLLSEEGKILTPVRRLCSEHDDGIWQIEITTFERGQAVDCLEGHYRFTEPGAEESLMTRMTYRKEKNYQIRSSGQAVLTSIELSLKPEYCENYRIGCQICADGSWSEWKWDGDRAEKIKNERTFCPITDLKLRLEEKSQSVSSETEVCYWADASSGYSWPAVNGEPLEAGKNNIDFLWLTCTIEGKKTDCLECRQHLQNIGTVPAPYWDSRYCFGQQGRRLEGVFLKLKPEYAEYLLRYSVKVEGEGEKWQEWRQDGALAGTAGKSKGILGIRIELFKNTGV